MQLFSFLFPLQHIKRLALQNKQVGVLRMAFRDFRETGPWPLNESEAVGDLVMIETLTAFFM